MEKLNILCQLLEEYQTEMFAEIPEKFKCIICQKILINAHQTTCGCNGCLKCFEKRKSEGFNYCPGNLKSCKEMDSLNVVKDYKINREICLMVVKCPEENCSHKCQLMDMDEHFRFCIKRIIKCPFYDLGCNQEKLMTEELNDHFSKHNYNHSKILIEIIDQLKNEVMELKGIVVRNNKEIQTMKTNSVEKDKKVEFLSKQIEKINEKNQILEKKIDEQKSIVENPVFKKVENESIINLKSLNNTCLEDQLKNINNDKDEDTNTIEGASAKPMVKIKKSLRKGSYDNIESTFSCSIGKVDVMQKQSINFSSEFFFLSVNSYKMQLKFFSDGTGKDFVILLLIHNHSDDESLVWPFEFNVTLSITNKFLKSSEIKSLTKKCIIEKPNINLPQSSVAFNFLFSELSEFGFLTNNKFILNCFIESF